MGKEGRNKQQLCIDHLIQYESVSNIITMIWTLSDLDGVEAPMDVLVDYRTECLIGAESIDINGKFH